MKLFRRWLVIISVLVITAQIILLDFDNLGFSQNGGNYLGIGSMVLVILSVILSQKHENNSL